MLALVVIFAVVIAASTGMFTINAVSIAEKMSMVMLGLALLYFAYLFIGGGLTKDEMKRVAVIIVLFFFATVFWAAFEQAPTSLNLFARDYTDRTIGGWEMPTLWLQSFNSFFVIALAPVFAALWTTLGRRNRDLSSPAKFSFGLLFAGLGFLLMVPAAQHIVDGGGAVRVAMWWLIGSYFLHSLAMPLVSGVCRTASAPMLSHGGSRLNASKPEANPKTRYPLQQHHLNTPSSAVVCPGNLHIQTQSW
jgi:POT family proton-dependent oligopeptide transporter